MVVIRNKENYGDFNFFDTRKDALDFLDKMPKRYRKNYAVNVPLSFYMSDLPFAAMTRLWFTGVNGIDGQLVFYDALEDTEQTLIDGMCIDIPTPEFSHLRRYYIRRRGYKPESGTNPITTDQGGTVFPTDGTPTIKFIKNNHVYILREGHIYTMFGQQIQ